MTQRPHPDDPPRQGDELLIEREEPATMAPDPSDAPASQAERTEIDPTLAARSPSAGGRLTTPVGSDELPYVDDRVSKFFVGAVVAVFAAIFAYGVLFGGAGLLTPDPTPRPSRAPTPNASPAASPSGSPAASPSESPSATPEDSPGSSPSASPDASPGASPSASPEASPSASPGASPAGASPSPTGS